MAIAITTSITTTTIIIIMIAATIDLGFNGTAGYCPSFPPIARRREKIHDRTQS